jgi:hypothetical protein
LELRHESEKAAVSSPLNSLANATKGAIRQSLDWALDRRGWQSLHRGYATKTDPVFQHRTLDQLRRAAYTCDFDVLFNMADEFPYVTPDRTCREVIGKLSDNMFPTGTKFQHEDKAVSELLQEIIDRSRIQLKLESVVTESAIMGFCGLRTVWVDELERWIVEVKQKEYLSYETVPGVSDEITAIILEWPTREEVTPTGKIVYWKKERWTDQVWQQWPEKPEKSGQRPEFKPEDATTQPNNYGEIPITLVPHYYDSREFGIGVVSVNEILSVKALVRLHHKQHYAHQKYMDPNPIRKNAVSAGEPLDLGIGKVIDVAAGDPALPVDLTLLEFQGIPESVDKEKFEHSARLYRAAGMKPPPPESILEKTGQEKTGIAIRMLDKDDAKCIETLRDNGYSNVIRHMEKMLRMGKRLKLKGYESINPDDHKTYQVIASYPDFFPPTDDDVAIKIANMNAAKLPPSVMAPRIAALFGIEDEAEKQAIEAALQKEQDRLEMETQAMFDPSVA